MKLIGNWCLYSALETQLFQGIWRIGGTVEPLPITIGTMLTAAFHVNNTCVFFGMSNRTQWTFFGVHRNIMLIGWQPSEEFIIQLIYKLWQHRTENMCSANRTIVINVVVVDMPTKCKTSFPMKIYCRFIESAMWYVLCRKTNRSTQFEMSYFNRCMDYHECWPIYYPGYGFMDNLQNETCHRYVT